MMDREQRARLASCPVEEAARKLARMHSDDAADVLFEMTPSRRQSITAALPEGRRRRVLALLGEEPATAEALMGSDFLCYYEHKTAAATLSDIRKSGLDPEATAVIYVADHHRRLSGAVPLKYLVEAEGDARLVDIMQQDPLRLRPTATFEEVARLITDFDLPLAPVVDDEQLIIGVVSADDVLEVMMPAPWRRRFWPPTDPDAAPSHD